MLAFASAGRRRLHTHTYYLADQTHGDSPWSRICLTLWIYGVSLATRSSTIATQTDPRFVSLLSQYFWSEARAVELLQGRGHSGHDGGRGARHAGK